MCFNSAMPEIGTFREGVEEPQAVEKLETSTYDLASRRRGKTHSQTYNISCLSKSQAYLSYLISGKLKMQSN